MPASIFVPPDRRSQGRGSSSRSYGLCRTGADDRPESQREVPVRLSFPGTSESGGSVVTTEHTAGDPDFTGRDHGASPGFAENFQALTRNIAKAIRGKDTVIHLMTLALVADGHVLVEDVPGVGKTSLGKALARSVDGRFGPGAIQPLTSFPPMSPASACGNRGAEAFEFRPGPVFANILLADEINRASPKTQSALLEAMAERQVTADGGNPSPCVAVYGDRHPEPQLNTKAPTRSLKPSLTAS